MGNHSRHFSEGASHGSKYKAHKASQLARDSIEV